MLEIRVTGWFVWSSCVCKELLFGGIGGVDRSLMDVWSDLV